MRPIRAIATATFAVSTIALASVVLTATPASAHDLGGRQPTDIKSEVEAIRPATPGVSVRVVELGRRIELRNDSPVDATVIGYDGEPYLRVGPAGTFENARSPAAFLNRTANPRARVPQGYDAKAVPEWRRVSGAHRVRWHDHRAHATRAMLARGSVPWQIELTVGGRHAVVEGKSTLVAPQPWWPWAFLAAGIAISIVVAARQWWRRTISLALVTLGSAGVVQLAGGWSTSAGSTAGRLSALVMPVLGLVLTGIAVGKLARDRDSAAPWALVAAVVLLVALGLGDILDWFRSLLPSSLPASGVRAIVALEIGGSIGVIVASATRLRAQGAPRVDAETLALEVDRRVVT